VTYRVIVPPDLQQEIWQLPAGDRGQLVDLFAQLQTNPDAATVPYGADDAGPVRMRTAAVGNVIAVVLVNETTGNVTLMQLTHLA
jgi:hypothetical protein